MELDRLNALDSSLAARALLQCCGSTRWAARMAAARPFASVDAAAESAGGGVAAGWTGGQLFLAIALAPVLGALAILVMRADQAVPNVALGPAASPSAG